MPKVAPEQITAIVREYQRLLGLKDWRITISFAPEDSSDMGGAECSPEYFKAKLTFNLDQLTNLKEAHDTIVHELMHVILSPYTEIVNSLFKEQVPTLTLLEETLVSTIEKWPLWRAFSTELTK